MRGLDAHEPDGTSVDRPRGVSRELFRGDVIRWYKRIVPLSDDLGLAVLVSLE
jgi:hypothetical protein